MRAEHFMYFCIKKYIGTQVEDLSTVIVLYPLPPPTPRFPAAYATDRSKAVVLVWFLVDVALCFFFL